MSNPLPVLRTSLAAAVLITISASRGISQEPVTCQIAAARTQAAPSESLAISAAELVRCPSTGPTALAAAWARPGIPAVASPALRQASGQLRDARLLGTVQGVASDGARPAPDRLLALQVLMLYEDPAYVPSTDLVDGGTLLPRRVGGPATVNGAVALPADYREQIGALLERLSRGDADETIRRAAHRLRQAFAYDDPASTPLPPNAITLVAGCGSELSLRSTADVDIEVELRIAETPFRQTHSIRAGTSARPSELHLAVPPGRVAAFFGGREVARLDARNGACRPGQVRWPER